MQLCLLHGQLIPTHSTDAKTHCCNKPSRGCTHHLGLPRHPDLPQARAEVLRARTLTTGAELAAMLGGAGGDEAKQEAEFAAQRAEAAAERFSRVARTFMNLAVKHLLHGACVDGGTSTTRCSQLHAALHMPLQAMPDMHGVCVPNTQC